MRGKTERNKKMLTLFEGGHSISELMFLFHISRERVRQIISRGKEEKVAGERVRLQREKLEKMSHDHLLDTSPLEVLEVSIRTANCLRHSGIRTIRQLLRCNPEDLLNIKNFGKESLKDLEAGMAMLGLKFNAIPKKTRAVCPYCGGQIDLVTTKWEVANGEKVK